MTGILRTSSLAAAVPLAAASLLAALACSSAEAPPAAEVAGYLPGAAGAELHYRVLGSGPDTVVVLHGGPGAGMGTVLPAWRPLADRFTLVFYDQRGGGRSTLPADTALLDARYFVEDLEAVRRHFGLERLKLVTHSFGSVLAASYAKRHPDRVDRMVFHGATGPRRAKAAELARRSPPSPDTALSRRMGDLLGQLLRGTAEDPVATCERYEQLGRRLAEARGEPSAWSGTTCDAPAEAVRYYYRYTAQLAPRSFGAWDFTTGLEDLDAPLLVVHGTRDSAALALQRDWAAAVPRGRLLAVPGTAKGPVDERPEIVLPAVAEFLGGAWPEGAEPVAAP
jgi:proline iminopeptidase